MDKASVQHHGDTVSNTVSTPVFDAVFEPVFETGHVSYFASVHSLENWDQCQHQYQVRVDTVWKLPCVQCPWNTHRILAPRTTSVRSKCSILCSILCLNQCSNRWIYRVSPVFTTLEKIGEWTSIQTSILYSLRHWIVSCQCQDRIQSVSRRVEGGSKTGFCVL